MVNLTQRCKINANRTESKQERWINLNLNMIFIERERKKECLFGQEHDVPIHTIYPNTWDSPLLNDYSDRLIDKHIDK